MPFPLTIDNIPAGSVGDAQVAAGAAIRATKTEHQHVLIYTQPSTVAAETRGLWIVRGLTGTIVKIDAEIVTTIATGGDRTATVDLKYGNASNAYATALSAPISFSSSDALRTVKSGTLTTTTLAVGDSLIIVVAVAGGSLAQAVGLLVTVTVREDAA